MAARLKTRASGPRVPPKRVRTLKDIVLPGRVEEGPRVSYFTAQLERIRGGLPFHAVEELQRAADLNLTQVAILLGIPERTIARRKTMGRLTTTESDRVDRAARVLSLAVETLGDDEKARAWMQLPNRGLGGQTPLSLLDTDRGVRAVEDVLARIDDGMVG